MYDTQSYVKLIKSRLSNYRNYHSLCVANKVKIYAKVYNLDCEKAYVAGVLHDITKEEDFDVQLKLIEDDGIKLTQVEKDNHKVYHQMSGASYIKNVLKIDDEDILNAVRYHTTGRANMSPLEMVVYLADFTSDDRKYENVDEMREECFKSLYQGMLYGLRYTIMDLASQNLQIHPDTLSCYNWVVYNLNKEKNE